MLNLTNITKIYPLGDNKVVALDDVNISFRENEFVSILGPSGCGKTTLLNIIGGLDRYTSGDLTINGVSTKDFTDRDWDTYRNNSIGFVFQNYNLIPHQTVLENVELALTLSGIKKHERIERAKKALEEVGLLSQANKKPNQLSGGQMQRVAIARALVNNPSIVLADEPTGALDSTTSLQVMDLLKRVANDRLVIMVTHNAELAEKYSTRIISLLDGKVVNDTQSYIPTNDSTTNEKPKKKSSMTWATSFKLSIKNLISKRTRTFLTSFAGSIGIIGIALVLSVANGFNLYINNLQQSTLASYPLTIYSSILDSNSLLDSFDTTIDEDDFLPISETGITASPMLTYEDFASAQHKNVFSKNYLDYIDKNILNYTDSNGNKIDLVTAIDYDYGTLTNLFTNNGSTVKKLSIPTYTMEEMMVNMDMTKFVKYAESYTSSFSSVNWSKLINNPEFVQENYDIVYGEYPNKSNQVALVINKKNQIDKAVLTAMGFTDEQIDKGFEPEDFIGMEYKLIPNDKLYTTTTMPTPYGKMLTISPIEADQYNAIYNSDEAITVTISCIMRINPDATNELYKTGLVYTSDLTDQLRDIEKDSTLLDAINASDIVILKNGTVPTIASKDGTTSFVMGETTISTNETWDNVIKLMGGSTAPNSIKFYAKDFASKSIIIDLLKNYNVGKEDKDQIRFSDTTSLITSTMGTTVDAISTVLIVFAGISLVVSSIMIGIITYVSVVERTREIGVLRALGARKKDISNVFIAETFVIGLSAGIIGTIVSYLLTFVINMIVGQLLPALANLAQLSFVRHALPLIVISFVLTMIAGLIPSSIASKKDPVIALRTE